MLRKRRGALELGARLGAAAQFHQQVTTCGGQQVIVAQGGPLGTHAEKIAVLNAHPRIGASIASLSTLSRQEQGTETDPATLAELARLNGEYESKFGFRFVVFVHGRRKEELVPVLRSRLARSRAAELATGVEEFLAIARDRLAKDTR